MGKSWAGSRDWRASARALYARRVDDRSETITAFVLGGGGKWGAAEIGMLRALVEEDVTPDLVVGTSVGAVNGAMFAADPTRAGLDALVELWRQMARTRAFQGSIITRVKNVGQLRPALNSLEPIRALLRRTFPVARIEELRIPFQCVASSIERSSEEWFTEGDLVEALLASAAVPGLFPPVEIDGEHYYDGGLVNSVPVDRAIALGATQIYVLHVGRIECSLRAPRRIHEAALVAFEIARRHRFESLRQNLPGGVTLHVLPTGQPLEYTDLRQLRWGDLSQTAAMIETARIATETYLSERAPT